MGWGEGFGILLLLLLSLLFVAGKYDKNAHYDGVKSSVKKSRIYIYICVCVGKSE